MDAVKYSLGDEVYLIADDENRKGVVTGIMFRPSGAIFYVSWGDRSETNHYDIELSRELSFSTVAP